MNLLIWRINDLKSGYKKKSKKRAGCKHDLPFFSGIFARPGSNLKLGIIMTIPIFMGKLSHSVQRRL